MPFTRVQEWSCSPEQDPVGNPQHILKLLLQPATARTQPSLRTALVLKHPAPVVPKSNCTMNHHGALKNKTESRYITMSISLSQRFRSNWSRLEPQCWYFKASLVILMGGLPTLELRFVNQQQQHHWTLVRIANSQGLSQTHCPKHGV